MTFDYTIYDVSLSLLTPLHIGSGAQLLKDYDYAVHGGRTWRINEDALLDAQDVADPTLADRLAQSRPVELLQRKDFSPDSPFFRYSLSGTPRASGEGAQLMEQLKTVHDEVYLPGSSLKGAIRTALAWHGWTEKGIKATKASLSRSRSFAGRDIERQIMGPNPNQDFLRALQVSDSAPAGKDCLEQINAQVVTQGNLGSPIELEAVAPDTVFQLTLKLDTVLFSAWARERGRPLGGNPAWLTHLPQLIQTNTTQRLQEEVRWYEARKGAEMTASFYRQLLGFQVPETMCLLQLGWGTGWGDKTYGSRLQADQPFMEYIISTYRLAKGKRQKGDPFPKSRRTTVQVIKDRSGGIRQRPGMPLGWVLMEFKERMG